MPPSVSRLFGNSRASRRFLLDSLSRCGNATCGIGREEPWGIENFSFVSGNSALTQFAKIRILRPRQPNALPHGSSHAFAKLIEEVYPRGWVCTGDVVSADREADRSQGSGRDASVTLCQNCPRAVVRTTARGECVQSLPEKPSPLPPWDMSFPGAFFCARVSNRILRKAKNATNRRQTAAGILCARFSRPHS
jgi:hypothetical protein